MSVTLKVFDGKNSGNAQKSATGQTRVSGKKELDEEENDGSPVRRRDTEAEARTYLDRHRLHEFMHGLFELLLREQPADPYSFIAQRFREAANLENNELPSSLPLDPIAKLPHPSAGLGSTSSDVLRSSVSTAPTIRKEPTSPLPRGMLQITVRSLRGRSLTQLTTQSSDRIIDVKGKIQACLGVPVTSQTLFWWADTLPNDTTLDDHEIPDRNSLHLVCSTRNPCLHHVLSGSSDGGLKFWSLDTGELIRDFSAGDGSETQKVQAVVVDWTGMRAVSGSYSGRLHLWDVSTGQNPVILDGHSEEVNALVANWPTMMALSGSSDKSARLWDLEQRLCVHNMSAGAAVHTLDVDWTQNRAFGGLCTGTVRMWNLTTGTCTRDITVGLDAASAANTTVSATAVDPCGNRAVSGLEDGHLTYWHFSTTDDSATPVPTTRMLLAHYSAVRTIVTKWVNSGSRALCGSDDGSLSLWRLDSQECLARFGRHVGMVWAMYADWNRDRVVSGAFDGCIKLWDLRNGNCLRTLQGHSRPIRSIAAG
jgi:WD40 repeat protein